MRAKLTILAASVLLACASHTLSAQDASQPEPLPTVSASTLLFLFLTWTGNYADTADPIDINAFNIDFGDGANGKTDKTDEAVDVLLQRN